MVIPHQRLFNTAQTMGKQFVRVITEHEATKKKSVWNSPMSLRSDLVFGAVIGLACFASGLWVAAEDHSAFLLTAEFVIVSLLMILFLLGLHKRGFSHWRDDPQPISLGLGLGFEVPFLILLLVKVAFG